MSKAAGVIFLSPSNTALFLRRTATAHDFPSVWDFPGGGCEGEETAEECATREAIEEIGLMPKGDLIFHTRTPGSMPKGVAGIGASPVLPVQAGAPMVQPPVDPANQAKANFGVSGTDVDFTTFLQKVENEFTPELNDEHDGWAWALIGSPPQPLHPGCQIALDRISMDELGVARAIADGRLTSPQRYENVWLFAIRITGTDTAYRDKIDEFVVRKPENYLTEEFLARCNGLPVIFKHPPKSILDSDEFSNRIVGTVFLPYIAGDEVWAVTKIYVDAVAQMMKDKELSTSPGVNFADFSVNAKLRLENGAKVLVEGKPSLLDHVAICELGVWDKGGDPSGIRSESREDSSMADEDKAKDDSKRDDAKRDDKAKDDASRKDMEKTEATDSKRDDADAGKQVKDEPTMFDSKAMMDAIKGVCDRLDAFGKRMDAVEDLEKGREDKSKKDAAKKDEDEEGDKDKPEKLAADKAKKDAAEKEEKEKADKAKKDAADKAKDDAAKADSSDIKKRIEEVMAMIPKDVDDKDYHALADAQARADEVFADFGKHAPRPLQGETVSSYERRCVRMLKEHSPTWKAAEVTTAFADDASFAIVRDQVYREAKLTAANPVNIQPGQLRMIEKKRDGHIIREFIGDPRSWMDPIAGPTRHYATEFKTGHLGSRS